MLERVRFYRIPQLASARHALVLGDGDGRFLARLLAANLELHADVIDQSPAMLRLLQSRAAAIGAASRIHIHHTDAQSFQTSESPNNTYDLVVTHFFLDCLTTEQIQNLAKKIRPHLTQNALWLISEFSIPSGVAALPARSIVAVLYAAFRIITGLRVRNLPDHAIALTASGLIIEDRRHFLAGLLISDLWKLEKPIAEGG
jgi:cyclopropane fatty-acyl-phospholipid synthase-like methyltransferase